MENQLTDSINPRSEVDWDWTMIVEFKGNRTLPCWMNVRSSSMY